MPGASPVTRYEVVVPATEPITLPSRTMRYRVGSGPLVGADQEIATEVLVARPAVSRVGCATAGPAGCLTHWAHITVPAAIPRRAAMAVTATTRLRRPERCLAAAPRAAAEGTRIAAEPAGKGARPGSALAGAAWAPWLCGIHGAGTAGA